MQDSRGTVEVKYLGKDIERNDRLLESKPPYNYYEMIVNLDGKDYTAVLETSGYIKMEYGIPDRNHLYRCLRLAAIYGPEERKDFEEANKSFELAEDESIGKKGENIDLDLSNMILDFAYGDSIFKDTPYADIQKSIMEDLYQRKRRNLISSRKKSFDERKGKLTLEDYILPQLPELSQQERARKMHDRMMQSVLTGRYGIKEYTDFMRKLVDAIKEGKILISDDVIKAMRDNFYYQDENSKHIHLFPLNSRKNISNTTTEELGDVKNKSTGTEFRLMDIEPVKSEFRDYIDELYQGDSATTLGRIAEDDRVTVINLITYDPRTGERTRRDTRGQIYVGEDASGDIIFVEQTDRLIESIIRQQDSIKGKTQEGEELSELASKEKRLQVAEKEAEKITELERLVEQREGKSLEQYKSE